MAYGFCLWGFGRLCDAIFALVLGILFFTGRESMVVYGQ